MAILIIPGKFNANHWKQALLARDPALDIRIWPDTGNCADITFVLVWHYPPGELKKYPHLKCISSLGAGVDHIFKDPELPAQAAIVRVVDPLLIRDMTHYILWAVLQQVRHISLYQQQQQQAQWRPHVPFPEITIGIMGLGQLGQDAAQRLHALKFSVIGWSRTAKKLPGIECLSGDAEWHAFLKRSAILVNLLPLTPQTENILNEDTFALLPKNAYIINVARGQHLVENDLLTALDSGHLSGACLDVFREEPLPANHPFWHHPKILITPHIASISNPASVAAQIVENYQRSLNNQPLLYQVNRELGY